MSDVSIFKFEESFTVRTIIKDNEPWFVAKDVCDVLGLTNSRVAVSPLDEDEKGVSKVYTPSGEQEMCVINESGLYALVIRSNKPNARKFRKWITSEVLPAIRKTGRYAAPVQPELPLDSAPVPAGRFSALKYQGVEVIPADELRRRLGITKGQLGNWMHVYKPLTDGVDVFRINGVSDKLAFAMIRAGFKVNPDIISVNLFTRSGFAKVAARFASVPEAAVEVVTSPAPLPKLSLPRLAPGVTPENFTYRPADHAPLFALPGKSAAERLGGELLKLGYDPTELLSEFHACQTAGIGYLMLRRVADREIQNIVASLTSLNQCLRDCRAAEAEDCSKSFRADGRRIEARRNSAEN